MYERPLDFPEHFVARRFEVQKAVARVTDEYVQAETLEAVRELIPKGLHRTDRHPSDDANIVEVWL